MKSILFICCLLLTTKIHYSNPNDFKDYEENFLFINNLKGKIKSLESKIFESNEGFTGKNQIYPELDVVFYIPNLISFNSRYEFAENGKLIFKEIKKNSSSSLFKTESWKLIYDDNWNVIEESQIISDDNEFFTQYEIDDNKIIKSYHQDNKGNTNGFSNFKYENNLLKEITNFDSNDRIVLKVKMDYSNNVLTKKIYTPSGMLVGENKIDIHGRYLKIVNDFRENMVLHYTEESPFPKEIIIYNHNNDRVLYHLNTSFDKKGNIIEVKINDFKRKVKILQLEYTYDAFGNWTKCMIQNKEKKDFGIIVREITYH